jgi:hypothetical protein
MPAFTQINPIDTKRLNRIADKLALGTLSTSGARQTACPTAPESRQSVAMMSYSGPQGIALFSFINTLELM